jgi:hypothetical protein
MGGGAISPKASRVITIVHDVSLGPTRFCRFCSALGLPGFSSKNSIYCFALHGSHFVLIRGTALFLLIAVEYVGEKLHVQDHPLGVMTTPQPRLAHEQFSELRKVLDDQGFVEVGGSKMTGFGQWLGMPGDFTPPSRFVRVVAYSTSASPSKTDAEAVLQGVSYFEQLRHSQITVRSARNQKRRAGKTEADYTL